MKMPLKAEKKRTRRKHFGEKKAQRMKIEVKIERRKNQRGGA